MATGKGLLSTTVGRKLAMALSALFLLLFLLQHLVINFLSVLSPDMFNEVSHFMGTNPVVQILLQPVLAFAVVFHFVMGFVLELQNRAARPEPYAYSNPAASSSWVSRNMIISGVVILLFMGLHFYDFWFPELGTKYIVGDTSGLNAMGEFRYFEELQHKFHDGWRVGIYSLSFIFLGLHLMHGFKSSFQSIGARSPHYTPTLEKISSAYAVVVPIGFIVIALYHFLAQ